MFVHWVRIEHSIAHIHTQDGLAESLVKHLQLIVTSLLMRTKLSVSIWGHAILDAVELVLIRPTKYMNYLYYSRFFVMSQIFPILEFLVCDIRSNYLIATHKNGSPRRLGCMVSMNLILLSNIWNLWQEIYLWLDLLIVILINNIPNIVGRT